MIPIIICEERSHPLEEKSHPLGGILSFFGGFAWIVGWKVAALRLGCDIPSLCNSMYLLDYSNTKLFS